MSRTLGATIPTAAGLAGSPFGGGSLTPRPVEPVAQGATAPRRGNPLAALLRQSLAPGAPATGLLGKSFADPRTQAVLAAAGSLLGAGGYTRAPTTLGQSIGPALSAYNTTMTQQAALETARRQQQAANALAVMGLQKPIKVGAQDRLVNPLTMEQVGGSTQPPAYLGTSTEAQDLNYLHRGIENPAFRSDPLYAIAFNRLAQPKISVDPASGRQITVTPDMSAFPAPTTAGGDSAMGGPGGTTAEQVMKPSVPFTDAQGRAAGFADRMTAADEVLKSAFGPAGAPLDTIGTNTIQYNLDRNTPGGNYLTSADYQRFANARRDFINAVLRRESGAAIAESEFAQAEEQYFPRPGDKPAVLEQKRKNRATAVRGMIRDAGPNYEKSKIVINEAGDPIG